jgi:hypothetical protein
MSFNITVEGGTSVRLPTAGKYCDRDIVITATGSGSVADPVIEPLAITENGTYTAPDGVDGYSPVSVNVPIPDGYIVPSGELEVTENGAHDVTAYASVNVNVPTGGGGGEDVAGAIADRTVTEFINNNATKIGGYVFRDCAALKTVDVPNAQSVGTYAFYDCEALSSVNMPLVKSVGAYAFAYCNKLKSAIFPSVTTLSSNALREVQYITHLDLPKLTDIPSQAFYGCRALTVDGFHQHRALDAVFSALGGFYKELYFCGVFRRIQLNIRNGFVRLSLPFCQCQDIGRVFIDPNVKSSDAFFVLILPLCQRRYARRVLIGQNIDLCNAARDAENVCLRSFYAIGD